MFAHSIIESQFVVDSVTSKMSLKYEVSPVADNDHDEVLIFLREYFFPQEPCAKAIDLCPHGYRFCNYTLLLLLCNNCNDFPYLGFQNWRGS